MRSTVTVTLGEQRDFKFDLEEVQPMPHEAARAWLDAEFTRMGCEPIRPTGKLLTADKVLCVAQAAGAELLGDSEWSAKFSRAVSASLAKPVVHIDVPAMTVGY